MIVHIFTFQVIADQFLFWAVSHCCVFQNKAKTVMCMTFWVAWQFRLGVRTIQSPFWDNQKVAVST